MYKNAVVTFIDIYVKKKKKLCNVYDYKSDIGNNRGRYFPAHTSLPHRARRCVVKGMQETPVCTPVTYSHGTCDML